MSNKLASLLFFLSASTVWVSCASYTDSTQEMREAYDSRQYDRALEALKKSGIAEKSQDQLLWRLEAATILDRKGEVEKSRALWLEADQVADELYTLSISKTAKSLLINDAAADYDGEDYEKVAIHSMLAHQFIGLGKFDEARVEARKINNKLNEINQRYDEKERNQYGEDAHARYLTGLIYESRGEWDSAIIDYSKAVELYEGAFSRYVRGGGVPHGLIEGLNRVLTLRGRTDRLAKLNEKYKAVLQKAKTGDAEVAVIHELGRVARKSTKEFLIPLGGQVIRLSFPSIQPRAIYDAGTGLEVQGERFHEGENTSYWDMIAYDTLENRRTRLVAKQAVRLLAKGQLTYQAQKNFGLLGGIAANVAAAATETADTRSWTTLPQAFYITRVRLAPGEHHISVKTNGRITNTQAVRLKKGQILILRSVE